MAKIYLAKSNRANYDDVALVRKHLTALGHTIEEFKGGVYSDGPMLQSDFVLAVVDDYKDEPIVGRGLFEQANVVIHNSDKKVYCYVPNLESIKMRQVVDTETVNTRDWAKYGKYTLSPKVEEFTDVFQMAPVVKHGHEEAGKFPNVNSSDIRSIL